MFNLYVNESFTIPELESFRTHFNLQLTPLMKQTNGKFYNFLNGIVVLLDNEIKLLEKHKIDSTDWDRCYGV